MPKSYWPRSSRPTRPPCSRKSGEGKMTHPPPCRACYCFYHPRECLRCGCKEYQFPENFFEKLKKLPGGDHDPFKVPVGPTPECLSAYGLADFVNQGEKDADIVRHIESCKPCRERVAWVKSLTEYEKPPRKKCIGCGKPGSRLCGQMWLFIVIYSTMVLLAVSAYFNWLPLP